MKTGKKEEMLKIKHDFYLLIFLFSFYVDFSSLHSFTHSIRKFIVLFKKQKIISSFQSKWTMSAKPTA